MGQEFSDDTGETTEGGAGGENVGWRAALTTAAIIGAALSLPFLLKAGAQFLFEFVLGGIGAPPQGVREAGLNTAFVEFFLAVSLWYLSFGATVLTAKTKTVRFRVIGATVALAAGIGSLLFFVSERPPVLNPLAGCNPTITGVYPEKDFIVRRLGGFGEESDIEWRDGFRVVHENCNSDNQDLFIEYSIDNGETWEGGGVAYRNSGIPGADGFLFSSVSDGSEQPLQRGVEYQLRLRGRTSASSGEKFFYSEPSEPVTITLPEE
jgi:hypothetical protein